MCGLFVRKVQRIGGQHVINIPRDIFQYLGLKTGDLGGFMKVKPDSAVLFRVDEDKLTNIRRQEALGIGEGKERKGADAGLDGGRSDAGASGVDGDSGGNPGAEAGDRGQAELQLKRDDQRDRGPEKGPDEDAGSKGGAGTEERDNPGSGTGGTDDKLKLVDKDAGPIDGNVME